MNHIACKALARISPFHCPLQCKLQPKRYLRTLRKRENAILRGLNAESGRTAPYNKRDSNQDQFPPLRSKPAFAPNYSINDTPHPYKEVELPPISEEAYPDANISTTSPYTSPSAEERRLARVRDDSGAPPPISSPSPRRSGDRPAPRLDRRNDRDDVLAPPRMTIRRHIPHVAKNSEFIFGTSVVEAAIKSSRRRLYRLYIYAGSNRTTEAKIRDEHMKKLARKHHPDIEIIDEGYVLDAEKLHKVPLLTLGKVSEDCTEFGVQIAQHTTNPDIRLRDQPRTIKCRGQKRYPFVLMVDEILDPGNLGAMIRSAYYLGAEAVIISGRNSAPLSAVCLKASAGASEYIPIYEYTNSVTFLNGSKDNGWKFYAAVPPAANGGQKVKGKLAKVLDDSQVGGALLEGPCCLILGQEGEGLRPWLAKQANYQVGIAKGGGTDPMVDSLNVSVAAAILCNRFLNPTVPPHPQPQNGKKSTKEAKYESGPQNNNESRVETEQETKSQPGPNKLF